jgi:hypothetical protein
LFPATQGGSEDRRFHVVITAAGSATHWQSRVGYYWFKKVKKQCEEAGGCQMGGFTRLLHTGQPDDLMNEIPTWVAQPLPAEHPDPGCAPGWAGAAWAAGCCRLLQLLLKRLCCRRWWLELGCSLIARTGALPDGAAQGVPSSAPSPACQCALLCSLLQSPLHVVFPPRSYIVLNRPYALMQWVQQVTIPEKYVLMSEPDHVWLRPMPNLMRGDHPGGLGGLGSL